MDVRAVRRIFTGKLGATEDRASHHIFYFLQYQGKLYLGSKMSHSWRGDLDDQQIEWIKKPLLLSKEEFVSVVDCSLSKDEFFNLWVQRKAL